MNILFLTVSRLDDINQRNIYTDLLREMIKRGNEVYIASPTERRFGKKTYLSKFDHCQILKIHTLNIQKTNVVEKGIGTLLLELQFAKAIRKYWSNVHFDIVLYSTPPITFNKVIEYIKKRDGARSYLMLKDIFPQNAVDLGMMKEGGLLHKMFRRKEERLYELSDRIGCMSPANCDYILKHNPSVNPNKVCLCPNAIEPVEIPEVTAKERKSLLNSLGIPSDKRLFIYGGNLGKPQGLDFLLRVVESNEKNEDSFIIVIGNGTEYGRIKHWFDIHSPQNAVLLERLPKDAYDRLVSICDVGLIFLDPRFTIPNFPSRLLSYLENAMPVLLATDTSTDMGRIAEKEGFGLWCENGDITGFMSNMNFLKNNIIEEMGKRGNAYMKKNYTVAMEVDSILDHSK